MVHLKMAYSDILAMPTNERRFHLAMLIKNKTEEREMYEEKKGKASSSSKGERTSKISGDALKNKLKSGEI
jgi:hypothetical protein